MEKQKEQELTKPAPRVRFTNDTLAPQAPPPRQIVASSTEQIVQPHVIPKPTPILKASKYESESITDRIKARRAAAVSQELGESIAERVARHRRERNESANPVLDQETGKLLEYRHLLKHPRFQKVWTQSAADKFGRLAQGIGG